MEFNVTYKESVKRDLKRLDRSEAAKILDEIENVLTKNPDRYPVLKGEFAGLRKYRIGNYRVIFAILNADVLILRIGHRKDVYK